jgi:ABC-2 type transport system permease protein
MAAMIVLLWPTYRNTVATIELPQAVQALLGSDLSYGTAAGFVSAEFFSWIPILLIVYAVIQGTGAIAGEESSGTIDLLMAQPLTRPAMVLQKCLAVLTGSALIVALGYLGFAVTMPFVTIEFSLGDAALASANMLPITMLFFALSLWLGAVAPNRAYASGVAIGVATAAYFANTIAAGVHTLSGLRFASPFYYYGAGLPLVKGIDWAHVSVLLGVAALFIALTVRSFQRRDITIGGASNVGIRALLRRATG